MKKLLWIAMMAFSAPSFSGKLGSFELAYGNQVIQSDDVSTDVEWGFVDARINYKFSRRLQAQVGVGTYIDPIAQIDSDNFEPDGTKFGDNLRLGLFFKLNVLNNKDYNLYAKGGYQYHMLDGERDPVLKGFSYGGGFSYKIDKGLSVGAEYLKHDLESDDNIQGFAFNENIGGYSAIAFLRFGR